MKLVRVMETGVLVALLHLALMASWPELQLVSTALWVLMLLPQLVSKDSVY